VVRHDTADDAVSDVDALVVGTEWPEYVVAAARLRERGPASLVIVDANRHLKSAEPGRFSRYFAVGTRVEGVAHE
jgi:hypothetical protein